MPDLEQEDFTGLGGIPWGLFRLIGISSPNNGESSRGLGPFRTEDLGFKGQASELGLIGLGLSIQDFGVQGSGFRVRASHEVFTV